MAITRSGREVEDLVNRMKRIEGQARGVQRMLEESRDCEEIILQLAAMRAALSKVAMALMSDHFRECMAKEGPDRDEALERAARMFLRFS
ncbi:metal-sensitive transcriptional regulator [Carboxydochorda subterranea]|uniref:Metal-sensitive transcriptional regulator n=1 Tax=Carboxydichorda subterranea TaxID=3109565 RepID=A0ABZ1BY09_9FIRM|nr:metal-sensitive transcriptional regulator [Limnochorda sp. L945t]WRP17694.1 metal-sensitive transcriptional regulator [Limnochorda sp. L945t]